MTSTSCSKDTPETMIATRLLQGQFGQAQEGTHASSAIRCSLLNLRPFCCLTPSPAASTVPHSNSISTQSNNAGFDGDSNLSWQVMRMCLSTCSGPPLLDSSCCVLSINYINHSGDSKPSIRDLVTHTFLAQSASSDFISSAVILRVGLHQCQYW